MGDGGVGGCEQSTEGIAVLHTVRIYWGLCSWETCMFMTVTHSNFQTINTQNGLDKSLLKLFQPTKLKVVYLPFHSVFKKVLSQFSIALRWTISSMKKRIKINGKNRIQFSLLFFIPSNYVSCQNYITAFFTHKSNTFGCNNQKELRDPGGIGLWHFCPKFVVAASHMW